MTEKRSKRLTNINKVIEHMRKTSGFSGGFLSKVHPPKAEMHNISGLINM